MYLVAAEGYWSTPAGGDGHEDPGAPLRAQAVQAGGDLVGEVDPGAGYTGRSVRHPDYVTGRSSRSLLRTGGTSKIFVGIVFTDR